MPTASDCRRAFLRDHALGVPFETLLLAHHIKRSAAYALLAEARELGADVAVAEKSRRPRSSPSTTPQVVVDAVIALKRKHMKWGPKKLLPLFESPAGHETPSSSTVANILAKHGLTRPYKPRQRRSPTSWMSRERTKAQQSNDVWAMDFKGKMSTYGGIEPFNVVDEYSRKWLCCQPFADKSCASTKGFLEELFLKHGLPKVMRVDAGQPWVSVTSPHQLTQLSTWLVALGVRVEVVSCPQENGILERLHGTMARDMTEPCDDVRLYFKRFVDEYNDVRPHEAFNNLATPSTHYCNSERGYEREKKYPYDRSFFDTTRFVTTKGLVQIDGDEIYLSDALAKRTVALRKETATRWRVDYCNLCLGHIDDGKFMASA